MLLVSRKDVNTEEIIEFPPEKRFIKLPIVNYLKLLNFKGQNVWENINRPQIALINAVNDPKYRFVCAALSRRLGKTLIANVIGQLVVLVPNCNVLIMSPNFSLSSISFDIQRYMLRQFDIELEKDNLKDRVIELPNGSTIRMGSISTVDSCVGRSYDLIIFDEAALGTDAEEAFNVSLRPTLDKPNSKAIFISTPRGKHNWFSVFWQRGFSDDFKEWVSLQADYTENHRMAASDVDEARRAMSKAEFEQEYLASFTVFEGQIYKFDPTNVVEYEHTDGAEYFAGLDPGYRDATAFVVVAYDYRTEIFHVVDEYLKSEVATSEHAREFLNFIEKWGIESVFIDSAAAQMGADLAFNYDISTVKAKKQVLEGIAFVQNIVENNRLRVAPHCEHTLAMLDQYQWDTKETLTKEKPLHNDFSHMADALRYALYTYTT